MKDLRRSSGTFGAQRVHLGISHPERQGLGILNISYGRVLSLTCSACSAFLAPPRGIAPLQITQLSAIADMGTSYFSAKVFISVRRGSICSQVRLPPNLSISAVDRPGIGVD